MAKRKRIIRIRQAADIIGVHPDTLRRWDNSGRLKALRTAGNQRYYTPEMLARWMSDEPVVYFNDCQLCGRRVNGRFVHDNMELCYGCYARETGGDKPI